MSVNSTIKTVSVSLLRAPLIQPFRTTFGEHKNLENLLLTLELTDGIKGFGEAAIATHITGETIHQTTENLNRVKAYLLGKNIYDISKISLALHEQYAKNKSVIAAVEMAILDALTRKQNIPLWKYFGHKCPLLTTDITIVIADLSETERMVKKFYLAGFRTFKIKIGRDQDLDLKRIIAIKKLTPHVKMILDVNQGYTVKGTLDFLRALKHFHIQPILIEQPVSKNDWQGLIKVTRSSTIPICADESVATLNDVHRAIRDKTFHAINIKLMKFGLLQAFEAALLAKRFGLRLMIGGMMESSLAMTAAAHLAVGLGIFDYVDLDTPYFIKKSFDKNPYLSSNGVYDLKNIQAGIGIRSL